MASYFLRGYKPNEEPVNFPAWVDSGYRRLIKHCLKGPNDETYTLHGITPGPQQQTVHLIETHIDIKDLEFPAQPPPLCAFAIARNFLLEHEEQLSLLVPQSAFEICRGLLYNLKLVDDPVHGRNGASSKLVHLGLECLFRLLSELNEKDSSLCLTALESLNQILESMQPGALRSESVSITDKLFDSLKHLWHAGCTEDVASLAATCMLGLSVACGSFSYFLQSSTAFICREEGPPVAIASAIVIPENLRNAYLHLTQFFLTGSAIPRGNWLTALISSSTELFRFQCEDFSSSVSGSVIEKNKQYSSVASDGKFLFAIGPSGLAKFGSGFSESKRGALYVSSSMFRATSDISLYACRGSLYLKRRHSSKLWVIDTDSLLNTGEILLPTNVGGSDGLLCSDGNVFLRLFFEEDRGLSITLLDDCFLALDEPETLIKFTNFSLAYGGEHSQLDIQLLLNTLKPAIKDHLADLKVGKDFAILLTTQGKVHYAGRGTAFEMVDSYEHWTEIPFLEDVSSIALGHGCSHFLAVTGSGQILFSGTATRGEDAEPQQLRKLPQPTRAKRLNSLDFSKAISASCNSGTSAFVTEKGCLYMYGKDALACGASGQVMVGLENILVSQVALGKAHTVVITKHGLLYTFGLNNMGQCGRANPSSIGTTGAPSSKDSDSDRSFRTTDDDSLSARSSGSPRLCAVHDHVWLRSSPTACPLCGKTSSTVTTAIASPVGANGNVFVRGGGKIQETAPQISSGDEKNDSLRCSKCGICKSCGFSSPIARRKQLLSQKDSDSDNSSRPGVFLPPARIILKATNPPVVAVVCGSYHSLVMTQDGQVFAFGSNRFGQLGLGDCRSRVGPQRVMLPSAAVQLATGANHSLVRTNDGLVYSFGRHHAGQLCREGKSPNWFADPAVVDGIDSTLKKRAIWISANGDLSFIRYEYTLINKNVLSNCSASATSKFIILVPKQVQPSFSYIVINRQSGASKVFHDNASNIHQYAVCMDPAFGVIWLYKHITHEMICFEANQKYKADHSQALHWSVNPEFWLPVCNKKAAVSPWHLGLTCLNACVMVCLAANMRNRNVVEAYKETNAEDYCIVDRFQGYGGGWGYSVQSAEAIQFMVNRNIHLYGIGLLGGRGEYWAKVKLLSVKSNDPEEKNVELLSEVEDITFECAAKDKCHILFRQPVLCQANEWYIIWAAINGSSSDCGSNGQAVVVAEDGVIFQFRNSRLSNNGTDVSVGQIPQLLYKSVSSSNTISCIDAVSPVENTTMIDDTDLLMVFQNSVESIPACFLASLKVLNYCVDHTMHLSLGGPDADWEMERLLTIAVLSVKVLNTFILYVYPPHGAASRYQAENKDTVMYIEETFQVLCNILSSDGSLLPTADIFFQECTSTIISCFHVFYPTISLFKVQMLDLLSHSESHQSTWMLLALLSALNENNVQPLSMLLGGGQATSSPMKHAPMLISHLQKSRSHHRRDIRSIDFEAFLNRLLIIIFRMPVENHSAPNSSQLDEHLQKICTKLLLKIVAELVTCASNLMKPVAITLLQTPARFSRKSSSTCWDTGNGTPDAIAFTVDVSWVSLHGVSLYLGNGPYTYNVELLVNQGSAALEEWQSLEKVSGVFGTMDIIGDTGLVKFTKPIHLCKNVQYALRSSLHGGKTWCGESGYQYVSGVRGVQFTFYSTSLSLNGTSISRGQMPSLLYSIKPPKHIQINAQETAKWVVLCLREVLAKLESCMNKLNDVNSEENSVVILNFVKHFLGLVGTYIEKNVSCILNVLRTLDDVLTNIMAKNIQRREAQTEQQTKTSGNVVHTSIESEHPYKLRNISSCLVNFPANISYLTVEFDERCSTACQDDYLLVYLCSDGESFVPVGRFWGSNCWPKGSLLLPGNCLWFVLESAQSTKAELNNGAQFGFKCSVTGLSNSNEQSFLDQIRSELIYLSAKACQILLTEPQCLVPSNKMCIDFGSLDEEANELVKNHGYLLSKGLRLTHCTTFTEIWRRKDLPDISRTSETNFLLDFINATSETAAGKLARWLMPEPYIDLAMCEFLLECERFQSGQPVLITILTKDQYGRIAFAPNIDVTVTVSVHDRAEEASNVKAQERADLKSLLLKTAYQPTYLNKARYISQTMMRQLENYSFEELRVSFVCDTVVKESLSVGSDQNGSYVARWIPKQSGSYRIECFVEDFLLSKSHNVDINNGKIISRLTAARRAAHLSRTKMALVKPGMTQGVRVRAGPTLSAQQLGVIPRGSPIYYVEETQNPDGVWLKLSDDSALQYCSAGITNPTSTWCLQFNRHTNRILMLRDSSDDQQQTGVSSAFITSGSHSVVVACEELYSVIKCGYTGLEIKAKPYRNAKVIGLASLSEEILSIGWLQNTDGIWIQLHKSSLSKYAFESDTVDGFCLVQEQVPNGSTYLDRVVTPEASAAAVMSASVAEYMGRIGCSEAISPEGVDWTDYHTFRQVGTQTSPLKDKAKGREFSTNRVGTKPVVHVAPQNVKRKVHIIQAMRPSLADCLRSVYSAFLWHEGLVHDAMACAAYLRFHPELHCLQFRTTTEKNNLGDSSDHHLGDAAIHAPLAIQLIHFLWKDISTAIRAAVQQHLILPSPPMALKSGFTDNRNTAGQKGKDECYCELCEGWYTAPVTAHMRLAHPGCEFHAGGQGYNSLGKYTSGWTGNCGDGGTTGSTWYLLCRECRQNYLRSTSTYKEKLRKTRGRYFRSSTNSLDPQKIIKQNATFLLDLNMGRDIFLKHMHYVDVSPKNASEWDINLYPQTSPQRVVPDVLATGKADRTNEHKRSSGTEPALAINPTEAIVVPYFQSDPGPILNERFASTENFDQASNQAQHVNVSANSKLPRCGSRTGPATIASTGDAFLISSPSLALKAAANAVEGSFSATLKRPVLAFVIQHHDLARIRSAMEVSIIRAAAFTHGFQVLNWLLRLSSNALPSSVLNILWTFVCATSEMSAKSFSVLTKSSAILSSNPLRRVILAGPFAHFMLQAFHNVLKTTAKLITTPDLFANNVQLQRLCLRSWCFEFTSFDHRLIVDCQLLQIITRILAAESNECGILDEDIIQIEEVEIDTMSSLIGCVKIDVSSRKAMIGCLTDGTMETFWESGDEDRNRSKWIIVRWNGDFTGVPIKVVALYVNNEKDTANRVASVCFFAAHGNKQRRIRSQTLDGRFAGWVKCLVDISPVISIELKGPDPTLRIRQLILLGGRREGAETPLYSPAAPAKIKHSPSSSFLQFSAVQADAFRLFQTVAAYVFSDELKSSEDNLLREQVLEIIFKRDQSLHALQEYIVTQISGALEKEVAFLRVLQQEKNDFSYCSGLLLMFRRVCSGTMLTRTTWSSWTALVLNCSELIIFAPWAIHKQILELYDSLFSFVELSLPDTQLTLTRLLIVIGKTLSLQVKPKGKRQSVATVIASNALFDSENNWFLQKPIRAEAAKAVMEFLVNLAVGKHGEVWAARLQNLLAECVLALTSYPAECRESKFILTLPSFWLCAAALSVLRNEAWLYGSPSWGTVASNSRRAVHVFCENHDDGQTAAHIWCAQCNMNLCQDCSSIFHLNKRRRDHSTTPLSFVDNDFQADIHEGCNRVRLSWILLLIDWNNLVGMVDFREDLGGTVTDRLGACRFCGKSTGSDFLNVCSDELCQQYGKQACHKVLECGHPCGGMLRESVCLPCLRCHKDTSLRQDAEDMCMICFVDVLKAAPAIQLTCNHVFHFHCVKASLESRWPGPRITFSFLQCPICKANIGHCSLENLLGPLQEIYADVARKALMRLEYDGLVNCKQITEPGGQFYQDPRGFALERYSYYICYKCKKAYFGGEAVCELGILQSNDYNPQELLCGACSDVAQAQICPKHGSDYLEYKCRYCCSIAVFFCFGTTHFCAACHDDFQRITHTPKALLPHCPAGPRSVQLPDGAECPLRVQHPPTGEEFALGCGICRNVETF